MVSLKNKKILISGVGKGIGKDIMLNCLKKGALVVGFSRSEKDIQHLKKKKFKNLILFRGDVTNQKFVNSIFKYLKKKKIVLNGLVNNAGIRQRKAFLKITHLELNKIINTNFISIFEITQKFIKQVNKKSSSSIVNIGSIVGQDGFSELTGYASTKSAINGFTKSLSMEVLEKNYNMRINCVNPGFTETSYFQKFRRKTKLYQWTLAKIPAKRWGKVEEISELASFLLSENSSYITGQSINIDGGWTK